MEKVREILLLHKHGIPDKRSGLRLDYTTDQAEANLRKIVEGCVPKEKDLTVDVEEITYSQAVGHNACRAKTLSNLKERFL